MIKINIEKAKEITKDRLRVERAPLLAQNDKDYIVATRDGADLTPVIEERQRLLDITELVDGVKTIDDLKTLTVEKI